MYPYHLGCHLKTGKLCRIPHPDLGFGIPQGFVRVIWYRDKIVGVGGRTGILRYKYYPYDKEGELNIRYWSIVRWTDIQRNLGEKVTGLNMLVVFTRYNNDSQQR